MLNVGCRNCSKGTSKFTSLYKFKNANSEEYDSKVCICPSCVKVLKNEGWMTADEFSIAHSDRQCELRNC